MSYPKRHLYLQNVILLYLFQDSVIMVNYEHIHMDSKYWEKPNEFYPEHFIDENSKLITKKEGFIAFSSGNTQL